MEHKCIEAGQSGALWDGVADLHVWEKKQLRCIEAAQCGAGGSTQHAAPANQQSHQRVPRTGPSMLGVQPAAQRTPLPPLLHATHAKGRRGKRQAGDGVGVAEGAGRSGPRHQGAVLCGDRNPVLRADGALAAHKDVIHRVGPQAHDQAEAGALAAAAAGGGAAVGRGGAGEQRCGQGRAGGGLIEAGGL